MNENLVARSSAAHKMCFVGAQFAICNLKCTASVLYCVVVVVQGAKSGLLGAFNGRKTWLSLSSIISSWAFIICLRDSILNLKFIFFSHCKHIKTALKTQAAAWKPSSKRKNTMLLLSTQTKPNQHSTMATTEATLEPANCREPCTVSDSFSLGQFLGRLAISC